MSHIEDRVCVSIQERAKLGLSKYGTSMERTDLSKKEWVQHAQEEALDLAIYLERLKTTSNPLSEDDMLNIIAMITACQKGCLVGDEYEVIKKKLQNVLNLG